MRLQQSDPIFNIGVDAMRPAFNSEPKYKVTMLTREDWTEGTGTGAGVYGKSVGRFGFSLGRYATVFQAEIYAILACGHEIQFQGRPEKHISALIGRFESSSDRQNISIGPGVPKGIE